MPPTKEDNSSSGQGQIDGSLPFLLRYKSNEKLPVAQPGDVYKQIKFDKDRDNFHKNPQEYVHQIRRKDILEKHPEVKDLMVKDPSLALISILVCSTNIIFAYFIQNQPWYIFTAAAYLIGATINHSLHIFVHDLTHYTAFESIFLNRMIAFICNISTALPTAMSFGKYHYIHHEQLGIPDVDPDLPLDIEIKMFRNTFTKILQLLVTPVTYAFRPFLISTRQIINLWEISNLSFIIFTNFLIYKYLGINALYYLLLSSYFSMSLHPFSWHTIAEHFEFVKGAQTLDYIGIGNFFNINVGYHVEHHDFQNIPWSKLPLLRKIAPEFYEWIPYHTSYVVTGLKYIFCSDIGAYARIDARNPVKNDKDKPKAD